MNIILAYSFAHNQVLIRQNDPGNFLLSELKHFYQHKFNDEGPMYDLELFCNDGKTVKAHSAVLAVASPFLKNVLKETWTPQFGASISLPDFNSKDIHHLIEFLYTGELSLSNRCDYESFQQLITELEIGLDDYFISVEEIGVDNYQTRPAQEGNSHQLTCNDIPPLIPIEKSTVPLTNGTRPLLKEWKNYQCERCGKSYPMLHLLKYHLRTHSSDRPYKCDMCDKAFRHPSNLNSHKQTHSEYHRSYSCTTCGKSFSRKYNLKVHQRTHIASDKSPLNACSKCSAFFFNTSSLDVHLKEVHRL